MLNRRLVFVLFLGILSVLFSGCSRSEEFFATESTAKQSSNLSPQITLTPTPLPTSTPQPTSTPTATVSFPVRNNTPIPDLDFPVIDAENADRLVEVARYGYAQMFGWQMLKPVSEIAVAFSDRFQFVSMVNKEVLSEIDLAIGLYNDTWYSQPLQFAASLDGSYVAGFTNKDQIEIWSRQNERVFTYKFDPISNYGHSLGLSVDGKLLAISSCEEEQDIWSGGYSCQTQIVNWSENETIKTVRGLSPSFTPNGKWMTIVFDKKVQFYSLEDWAITKFFEEDGITSTIFSQDAGKFAFVYDDYLEVYDSNDFRLIRFLPFARREGDGGPHIFFSEDGERLLLDLWYFQEFLYIELETGNRLEFKKPEFGVWGWMVAGDKFNFISVDQSWEFTPSEGFLDEIQTTEKYIFKDTTNPDRFELFLNDKKMLEFYGLTHNYVIGYDENFILIGSTIGGPGPQKTQLFDLKTGKRLESWNVGSYNFIRTDKWWSWRIDHTKYITDEEVIIYDLVNKNIVFQKVGVWKPPMINSKEGLAGYLDYRDCIHIVNLIDGNEIKEICIPFDRSLDGYPENEVVSSAISPDGCSIIVSTVSGSTYLVNIETSEVIRIINEYSMKIEELRFSENGTKLGTFNEYDGFTRIWAVLPED